MYKTNGIFSPLPAKTSKSSMYIIFTAQFNVDIKLSSERLDMHLDFRKFTIQKVFPNEPKSC